MGDSEMLAPVRKLFQAAARRDAGGYFAAYHTDVVISEAPSLPYGGDHRGAEGVMRHAEATFESLDYMAAVAVSDAHRIPDGLTRGSLPAGTYAAFSYSLSRLGQGFHDIFNRLLPDSGWIQAPGPYFERYGASFDPKNPESAVEILIPVKR